MSPASQSRAGAPRRVARPRSLGRWPPATIDGKTIGSQASPCAVVQTPRTVRPTTQPKSELEARHREVDVRSNGRLGWIHPIASITRPTMPLRSSPPRRSSGARRRQPRPARRAAGTPRPGNPRGLLKNTLGGVRGDLGDNRRCTSGRYSHATYAWRARRHRTEGAARGTRVSPIRQRPASLRPVKP